MLEASFSIELTTSVNSSYERSLALLQNFLAAKISLALTDFRNWELLFALTGLNLTALFWVPTFRIIFLLGLAFLIVAFFPANSLTLKPLELFFTGALGILLPFLLAAIAAPLSTSKPAGGLKKSSDFFSCLAGIFASVLKLATKSNVSSRKSSEFMFALASNSSFSRCSVPTEIMNINPLILI